MWYPRSFVSLIGVALLVSSCARLTSCGRSASVPDSAPAPINAVSADTYDLAALLANADPEQGRMYFTQCGACHSLEPGEHSQSGPNLYGMFGRKAAAMQGFSYSEALHGSQIIWTAEELDHWLRDPLGFVQGSRMVFLAIDRPQDRANLIAYLMRETDALTVPSVPGIVTGN